MTRLTSYDEGNQEIIIKEEEESKYRNNTHKTFVEECCAKAKNSDVYHKALFYTLGLTEDCQRNINDLYDWSDRCVKPLDGLSWITGTDMRIIRLAYNLFNNGAPTAFELCGEEKESELEKYTPTSIFSYLSPELREYCFEAIRIRFEMTAC